ncbi:MAG: DNA-directed RNA polymerase subunit beta' [Opitutales bacterium]|nr:DNA-directed RNA polymerase subunit beta' [Opitutales bacterium]
MTSEDYVSVNIASPETIRSWSYGEVKNAETINYRSQKPEEGGLFCQKIFGPVKDFECACGRYKHSKNRGTICEKCGVEVTVSSERRRRMGHIELAVPVAHIWFLKSQPSCLSLLLDMTPNQLESVIYYEKYLVTDAGTSNLEERQLLTSDEYEQAVQDYGSDGFVAERGAKALHDILEKLDLNQELKRLRDKIVQTKSYQNRQKLTRRLRVIQGFIKSGNRPEWMILTVLPVIPPDLRPLVPLDGGRFAASDLNELYRRVINRNKRLKDLLDKKTPLVIIDNEKRMLQEAVDALFDNGRHGRPVAGPNGRPLKSLADGLKGKQGRFRQNLLGKRVDYSGRSVIAVGPDLKLNQCGLPKEMALKLFEPFIIRRLMKPPYNVATIRAGKKAIERRTPDVWDVLDEVTKGHPVMLNRAPTLHRVSIQAFEPKLIEGKAMRLHPLACTAFNADFDGDQMAVHVPLSTEAEMECKLLMLSTNNLFSPSSGKPLITPSQDVILGAYYLTYQPTKAPEELGVAVPLMGTKEEVLLAEADGSLHLHSWIDFVNPDYNKKTLWGNEKAKIIRTTVGRVIFNQIWPEGMGFVNVPVKKGEIGKLIAHTYDLVGKPGVPAVVDALKNMGYRMATRAGISMSVNDMIPPPNKEEVIKQASVEAKKCDEDFHKGVITDAERYNTVVNIWTRATKEIADKAFDTLKESAKPAKTEQKPEDPRNDGRWILNPVWVMMDSGARGNRDQVRQLCGARGLMAKPDGAIIERPILSSFRDGLSIGEYFISSHGARKGLSDTALKTADAGYMTRKLCDVAMDVIVTVDDDGNRDGIWKEAIEEEGFEIPLHERIYGRCSSDDVVNPATKEIIVKSGEMITNEMAKKIEEAGIKRVKIMSPLTHMNVNAIPALAYGLDPSTNKLVKRGASVGIIAAQSIGEPGTQLTMRTFHVGGVASKTVSIPEIRPDISGVVQYKNLRFVPIDDSKVVVLNKTGSVQILDKDGKPIEEYPLAIGTIINVLDGGKIEKGQLLAKWDPDLIPILSAHEGRVRFKDITPGITVHAERNDTTGDLSIVVIDHPEDVNPEIEILDKKGKVLEVYPIPVGAQLKVLEDAVIKAGAVIATTPRAAAKSQDITGGLPRVAELFEARNPKDAGIMARVSGRVSLKTNRGKKQVVITPEGDKPVTHVIPNTKHITVSDGDFVEKGTLVTEGAPNPREILEILGREGVQDFLVREILSVYRRQGVTINDKHIEVIVARMLRKVRITDPGDTTFLQDEKVDVSRLVEVNKETEEQGGDPAKSEPILLGITKASLETESFIAAASFQETPRVLTEAATFGKKDVLKGFKENVIMGHRIPAGTGLPAYQNLTLVYGEKDKGAQEMASVMDSDLSEEDREYIKNEEDVAVVNDRGELLDNDEGIGMSVDGNDEE